LFRRAQGGRKINSAIDKNRGLTPHRRKDIKNPRKHNRAKFEAAKVRRKGAVQELRQKSSSYPGEATGINPRVSKSVRFAS
jgi:U3 small nucleolar RNA-associated protein 3